MNKVILMGRIVRDPDIRYSQGEPPMAVARYTLAANRKYKKAGEQEADFINCVSFGKVAEVIEKYGKKGIKLIVEGRWQTGSYVSKDGQKIYTNDCYVENIEFAESKNSSSGSEQEMGIPDSVEDEEMPFN